VAPRPLGLDEKAGRLLEGEARTLLAPLRGRLATLPDWTVEALEAAIGAFAEAHGLKLGKVAQPLRAALTGRAASPGIYEVLLVLGRDESLARIGDQVSE
jgi:glutamyl-tRNA synthetase